MEVPNETLDELLKLIDNLIFENEQLKSSYRIQNKLLIEESRKKLQTLLFHNLEKELTW